MKQLSFAQAEFAGKKKVTRRERFLGEMEQIVPWAALIAALKPYYFPDAGTGRGRRPIGLERMLRMYCLQQWYALADEALEDAIYDSQALRNFVGIDLSRESVPDATTLLGFRHLLEANGHRPNDGAGHIHGAHLKGWFGCFCAFYHIKLQFFRVRNNALLNRRGKKRFQRT